MKPTGGGDRRCLPLPRFMASMEGTTVWIGVDLAAGYGADPLVWGQLEFELRRARSIAFWDWLLPDTEFIHEPERGWRKGWCSRRRQSTEEAGPVGTGAAGL